MCSLTKIMKANEYNLTEFLHLLQNGSTPTARSQQVLQKTKTVEEFDHKKYLAELNKDLHPYHNFSSNSKRFGKKK